MSVDKSWRLKQPEDWIFWKVSRYFVRSLNALTGVSGRSYRALFCVHLRCNISAAYYFRVLLRLFIQFQFPSCLSPNHPTPTLLSPLPLHYPHLNSLLPPPLPPPTPHPLIPLFTLDEGCVSYSISPTSPPISIHFLSISTPSLLQFPFHSGQGVCAKEKIILCPFSSHQRFLRLVSRSSRGRSRRAVRRGVRPAVAHAGRASVASRSF